MTGAMNPSGSKMEEIIDRMPRRDIKVGFGRLTEKEKILASKFHFIPSTRSFEVELKSSFCKDLSVQTLDCRQYNFIVSQPFR